MTDRHVVMVGEFCGETVALTPDQFREARAAARALVSATEPATPRAMARGKGTDPGAPSAPLMTARELADALHLPVSSIAQKARDGRIPSRMLGRYRRFDRREVEVAMTREAFDRSR